MTSFLRSSLQLLVDPCGSYLGLRGSQFSLFSLQLHHRLHVFLQL